MNEPIDQILEDVIVDAESRELAHNVYRASLQEGADPDEALNRARDALRGLRLLWEDAKRQDEER